MTLSTPQTRNILRHNVSWQEFEEIIAEMGETPAARIAYDRGTLEIIMPLPEHEYFRSAIGDLIKDLADELGLDYECLGSTTWKNQAKLAGIEADDCFFIQNEAVVRQLLLVMDNDVSHYPPPDLALEIDITSKSLNREPIYARLGIPEIWRYDRGILRVYQLQGGEYQEVTSSLAFPNFPVQEIPSFIGQNISVGRRVLRQLFRDWVKKENL